MFEKVDEHCNKLNFQILVLGESKKLQNHNTHLATDRLRQSEHCGFLSFPKCFILSTRELKKKTLQKSWTLNSPLWKMFSSRFMTMSDCSHDEELKIGHAAAKSAVSLGGSTAPTRWREFHNELVFIQHQAGRVFTISKWTLWGNKKQRPRTKL